MQGWSHAMNYESKEQTSESGATGATEHVCDPGKVSWLCEWTDLSFLICKNEDGEFQNLRDAFQLKDSQNQSGDTLSWFNIFLGFGDRKQIQLSHISLVSICLFTLQFFFKSRINFIPVVNWQRG